MILPRNDPSSKVRGALTDHVQFRPSLDVVSFEPEGQRVIEILVSSKLPGQERSWVRICRGVTRYASQKKKKAPDDEVQVDDGGRVCHECCGQPFPRIRATKRSPENWTAAQLHIDYETKKGVVSCLCNKKKRNVSTYLSKQVVHLHGHHTVFLVMMVLHRGNK